MARWRSPPASSPRRPPKPSLPRSWPGTSLPPPVPTAPIPTPPQRRAIDAASAARLPSPTSRSQAVRAAAAGADAMTNIQWSDGAPIYRQLKERVIAMMLDGLLKPGDALPSVRQVAAEYQLNPITVSRAYQELADEALVEKRR